MALKTAVQERRRFARNDFSGRVAINLLQPKVSTATSQINLAEGGLCLRLYEALEVRSLVRLRLTPEGQSPRVGLRRKRGPMECSGRVAWVIQRLDLRDAPPFLYDVGIEFVDPPALLRQWIASAGTSISAIAPQTDKSSALSFALIRGRRYVPRLVREPNRALSWHLIVLLDGMPCFSGHFATEREALEAWVKFKRQEARGTRREAKEG